jgi:septum site-determining protein MinC
MDSIALDSQRVFEIKSMTVDLMSIVLKSIQPQEIARALDNQLTKENKILLAASFLLDLSIATISQAVDLKDILATLKQHGILIVALCHPDANFEVIAKAHGLGFCLPRLTNTSTQKISATAMVMRYPVRTGQQIYAQGRDLIVLNIVNAGAEVAADGHIHVYAPLRGRALAGAKGDKNARIFVQSMEAELISIAGIYRTLDQDLPNSMHHQMMQVYLEKDRLMMTALTL